MADTPLVEGVPETPVSPETPVQSPEPVSAPPVQSPEPVAQAPAEHWDDIRDYAKSNGLDISHIPDSEQAAKYLIDRARANDAYTQYGQQLAPYYQQFQQFLAAQQQQQRPTQPQTPEQKRYFGLPEYDPQWLEYLEKDAAGNIVPKPGAPPDVLHKVVQYQKALQNFQTNFWSKPEQYLQPMIEDRVAPLVERAIQQRLGQYQDQVFATNFVAENTKWLHSRDTQGNVLRDPLTGQYVLTPEGSFFTNQLRRAEQMGIGRLQDQQEYAMNQMRLAYWTQQANQQQAVNQGQQQNQQFLQQHNRRVPNHSGSVNAGPDMSQNPQLSLRDRLIRDLQQGGVTDSALIAPER